MKKLNWNKPWEGLLTAADDRQEVVSHIVPKTSFVEALVGGIHHQLDLRLVHPGPALFRSPIRSLGPISQIPVTFPSPKPYIKIQIWKEKVSPALAIKVVHYVLFPDSFTISPAKNKAPSFPSPKSYRPGLSRNERLVPHHGIIPNPEFGTKAAQLTLAY